MTELMTLKVSKPTLRSDTLFIYNHHLIELQCGALPPVPTRDGEEEIPIYIDGKLYNIHFAYSQLLRCMIPHLMVAEGEYKGFIGPQLREGEIQVTLEAFNKFFWVKLFKHGTTTAGDPVVWSDTVQTLETVQRRISEGWLVTKPECKEKAQ